MDEKVTFSNNKEIKAGTIKIWPSESLPQGWLFCDGSSYNISSYKDLFDSINYNYGGSGNTFAVPDLRDRFPKGRLSENLGCCCGSNCICHCHNILSATLINSHTSLSIANESSHSHSFIANTCLSAPCYTLPSHSHSVTQPCGHNIGQPTFYSTHTHSNGSLYTHAMVWWDMSVYSWGTGYPNYYCYAYICQYQYNKTRMISVSPYTNVMINFTGNYEDVSSSTSPYGAKVHGTSPENSSIPSPSRVTIGAGDCYWSEAHNSMGALNNSAVNIELSPTLSNYGNSTSSNIGHTHSFSTNISDHAICNNNVCVSVLLENRPQFRIFNYIIKC